MENKTYTISELSKEAAEIVSLEINNNGPHPYAELVLKDKEGNMYTANECPIAAGKYHVFAS